jgi:hypothetical protein
MKYFITTLLSVLTIELFGQTVDSLGLDNNPRLNKYEADYLNKEFKDQRKDFDFADKKVAFITGSSAGKHWTKIEYFNELKERLKANSGITDSAIFFTPDEKANSGDYDVVVTSWVKLLTDKRRRQIISELKAASR